MKRFTSVLPMLMTAWSGLSLLSTAVAAPEEIALAKCPTPVQKAFRDAGTVGQVLKDTQKDGVFYEADITAEGGSHVDLVLNAEGKMVKKSEEVKIASCPEVVKKIFLTKSIGKTVASIELITDDGGISYLANIKSKDDLILQVEVGADGKIIAMDEQLGQKNTPEAISKVIKEKAAGGKVEEVHKQTDGDGKISFSAVITTKANVVMNLELEADGKVVAFEKEEE